MKKTILLGFALITFFICSTYVFGQTGARILENNGNFSYRPPLNWNVTEYPGLKYRVLIGPTEGGLATNINFVDDTFNGNLTSYVDFNLSQLRTSSSDFRLLSRETFRTNSGIVGEKVAITYNRQGFILRQVFYFLPERNNVYFVVTGTVINSDAAKYLSIFDESIKTFELIQ
jgi:hypothetical protein